MLEGIWHIVLLKIERVLSGNVDTVDVIRLLIVLAALDAGYIWLRRRWRARTSPELDGSAISIETESAKRPNAAGHAYVFGVLFLLALIAWFTR